jgi:hypothetical protein
MTFTAEDARKLWPDESEGQYLCVYDYEPLLKTLAPVIVLQVDDEDYQGDSRVLFRDGDRWGVLLFGWGSCSGCDALQACDTWEEIAQLRNQLAADVHWEPSKADMLHYIETHDWEGEYAWHEEETKSFLHDAKELLSLP